MTFPCFILYSATNTKNEAKKINIYMYMYVYIYIKLYLGHKIYISINLQHKIADSCLAKALFQEPAMP